jgi:ferritin-like metal-binding protein YciE
MKVSTIEQTLVEELKDLYDAEKQLVKALPKMAKAASSPKLREAFSSHLEETKGHVERLSEVFAALGVKASSKSCAAMKGLVSEGGEAIEQDAEESCRDAILIGAAQRVEHYEMAAYGTARTLAEHLGNDEAVSLLQQTLDEEKAADEKLTSISLEILETMGGRGFNQNDGEPGEEEEQRGRKTQKAGHAS